MIDERGAWYCDHCGGRAARGGITTQVRGKPPLRGHVKLGPEVLYCSERCLRNCLFGLDPEDDPVEQLTRRVRSLERTLQRVREDVDSEREEALRQADESLGPLNRIREQLLLIRQEALIEALPDSDEGQRLALLLRNMLVVSGVPKGDH